MDLMVKQAHIFKYEWLTYTLVNLAAMAFVKHHSCIIASLLVCCCLLSAVHSPPIIKETSLLLSAYYLHIYVLYQSLFKIKDSIISVGSMQNEISNAATSSRGRPGGLCLIFPPLRSLPHLGWQRWFWALAAPWTSLRLTHYPGPQTQSHICNKPGDRSTRTDTHRRVWPHWATASRHRGIVKMEILRETERYSRDRPGRTATVEVHAWEK